MTKINIGSKDVEYNVDKGFCWVACDISTYEGGFQAFFHWVSKKKKKLSMTKINIGSKDAEYNTNEGFSWVSCDILTYEGVFQAFLSCVSQKGMKDKNEHGLKKCEIKSR
jgi:hypothetical protein